MTSVFLRLVAVLLTLAATLGIAANGKQAEAAGTEVANSRPLPFTKLSPTRTTSTSKKHHSHLLTNAQRFAVGLPPLRPRSLMSATQVRRSRASASPSASTSIFATKRSNIGAIHTGYVQIVDPKNHTALGYLSRSFTTDGYYLASQTFHHSSALEVSLDPGLSRTRLGNIEVLFPQDDDSPFLGLIAFTGELREHMNHNLACLGMAPLSLPRPRPLETNRHDTHFVSFAPQETPAADSVVWKFDPSTSLITPRWTYSHESKAALVLSRTDSTLCIAANQGALGPGDIQVELRLAPVA